MSNATASAGRNHIILMVEDNLDVQIILSQQLTSLGYQVVMFGEGKSAVEWLETHRADLILLDWMLPDMNGVEVCRLLRQKYSPGELPILMLTALGTEVARRVEAIQAGANDVLPKPYHMEELAARVGMLIGVKETVVQAETLLERHTSRALRRQAGAGLESRREYRHAVILFADLRGFTTLTATAPPEDVMRVLDGFFELLMQTIEEHGGIVFDLTGDEMLAVFNIPHEIPAPAFVAVKAAQKMQDGFRALREQWATSGYKVGLGIGLHQGQVMAGNIGSSLQRYAVIGYPVNYAHRLVEVAEDGCIVTSAEIYEQLKPFITDTPVHALAEVRLKGIDDLQTVYQLGDTSPT